MAVHAALQVFRLGPGVGIQQVVVVHVRPSLAQQLPQVLAFGLQQQVVVAAFAGLPGQALARFVDAHHQVSGMALRQASGAVPGAAERIQHQWAGPGRQLCQQLEGRAIVGCYRFREGCRRCLCERVRQFWVQVLLIAGDLA